MSKKTKFLPGILFLKRALMGSIGKFVLLINSREEMPSYFVGKPFNVDSLLKTHKWLYFNEVVHFFLIFTTGAIVYYLYKKTFYGGAIFLAFFVLLNIALVALQHTNRNRIKHTIESLRKRKNTGSKGE